MVGVKWVVGVILQSGSSSKKRVFLSYYSYDIYKKISSHSLGHLILVLLRQLIVHRSLQRLPMFGQSAEQPVFGQAAKPAAAVSGGSVTKPTPVAVKPTGGM